MSHLMMGNFFLWANISGYVVAYYHYLGDKNATIQNSGVVLSLTSLTKNLVSPLGAFLYKRVNTRIIIFTTCAICIGSVYMASVVKSWGAFLVFFAVLFPSGIGMCYWIPIFCAWEHFPNNKCLFAGIIMAAFGVGPSIFAIITTAIANPDDLKKVEDKNSPLNA